MRYKDRANIWPNFIANVLPLALIAGGIAGAWSWLMYKRNKVSK